MRQKVFGCGVIGIALVAVMAPLRAQNSNPEAKAADVLAAAHKAIGNNKLDALKTFSVQAAMQRNLGSMQMQAEVEMLLEMPDKYVRTDVSSGMMNMTTSTGFNGDKAIMPAGRTRDARRRNDDHDGRPRRRDPARCAEVHSRRNGADEQGVAAQLPSGHLEADARLVRRRPSLDEGAATATPAKPSRPTARPTSST